MIRLIDANNALPVTVKLDEKTFQPGMIAQLYANDGVSFKLSNGSAPFGIVDDIKDDKFDSTANSGLTTIWPFSSYANKSVKVIKTDQFIRDQGVTHQPNDPVYVLNGQFSLLSSKFEAVGRIVEISPGSITIELL